MTIATPRHGGLALGAAAGLSAALTWALWHRRSKLLPEKDDKDPVPPSLLLSLTIPESELRNVFDAIDRNKDGSMGKDEFKIACLEELQFDLSETEISRIFDRIDVDHSGKISFDEFDKGVRRVAFLRTVISNYSPSAESFAIPDGYDFTTFTNANYGVPADTGFHGDFMDIRASRDYGYHVNYARDRQLWQDSAINKVVVRTNPQPKPWIVFTCGPMGAGKGFVMSWMSTSGIFPLERIVHIDPDFFKRIMPEWPGYVARDAEKAGSLCHRESGFMQEIAQEAALRTRQHIWVDGSLRDGDWFAGVFDDIRTRYPEYRIAIFYVYASEATVRARIASRARETGRSVPESLIQQSLASPDRSIKILTPKTDFVARISNDKFGTPVLEAVEAVDRGGCWNVVRDRFARTTPLASEFPLALPARCVRRTRFGSEHITVSLRSKLLRLTEAAVALTPELTALRESGLLADASMGLSTTSLVNLRCEARTAAQIPTAAVWFAFAFGWLEIPAARAALARAGLDPQGALARPEVALLLNGGWVYFDVDERLTCANAMCDDDDKSWGQDVGQVQFGEGRHLAPAAVALLEKRGAWRRVHPDTPLHNGGARRFAWLGPGESVATHVVGGRFGSFAFHLNGGDGVHFTVI